MFVIIIRKLKSPHKSSSAHNDNTVYIEYYHLYYGMSISWLNILLFAKPTIALLFNYTESHDNNEFEFGLK